MGPLGSFYDMDVIRDTESPYPQMLPSASHFADCVSQLGITPEDAVVVYDTFDVGFYSAPRVAWMFRQFGHARVYVLNNFRLYVGEGYPVEQGDMPTRERTKYPAQRIDESKTISFDELRSLIQSNSEDIQVLDARPPDRFTGVESDANATLSPGHMPKSINIPLASMLDTESQTMLPAIQLKGLFAAAGVDPSKPKILTCNSGVTAAALDMALTESQFDRSSRRLYDGSWSEWAHRAAPIGLIEKSSV